MSGSLDKDTFVCEVCGSGFATKEKLKVHLYQHGSDKVEERLKRAL